MRCRATNEWLEAKLLFFFCFVSFGSLSPPPSFCPFKKLVPHIPVISWTLPPTYQSTDFKSLHPTLRSTSKACPHFLIHSYTSEEYPGTCPTYLQTTDHQTVMLRFYKCSHLKPPVTLRKRTGKKELFLNFMFMKVSHASIPILIKSAWLVGWLVYGV